MGIEEISVRYNLSGFPIELTDQIIVCHFRTLNEFVKFTNDLNKYVECREISFSIDGMKRG